jgi:hypothetical protein
MTKSYIISLYNCPILQLYNQLCNLKIKLYNSGLVSDYIIKLYNWGGIVPLERHPHSDIKRHPIKKNASCGKKRTGGAFLII